MAKPTKKYLLELVVQHGPEIAKAFKASLASIKGSAQVGALTTMLEKGDISGALLAIGLDPASFRKLDQAISDAFESGGGKAAQTIPPVKTPDGLRMVVQFNARNDRAEQWLKDQSSTLIREIIDDQRQMIRSVLADGMARGLNPRDVALDLVGRLDPVTRTRQGGVIGLTSQQLEYVQRYRAELLSGDPAQLRNALARVRRDRKFDGAIRKAIAAGKPIDPAAAEKMVGRYSDRLLLLRGETIGRTEAMTALHQSQEEAYQQAIDKGALQSNHIRYFWRTAADERVRHSHALIPGMNEKGVPHGTPFSSPLGPIRFPGDPNATAANRIGCRCWREPKVDFLAQAVEAEQKPKPAPKPKAPPKPKKPVPPEPVLLPQRYGPDGTAWPRVPSELADRVADELLNSTYPTWRKEIETILKKAPAPYKGLSVGQAGLINWYTGSGYRRLNKDLREGTGNWLTPMISDALNGALDAVTRKETGLVTRGLNVYSDAEITATYAVGAAVEFPAFTSTGRGFSFGGNVRMIIEGSSGVDVKPLSRFRNENEVLFKAGTRFIVTGMAKRGNVYEITLKEVADDKKSDDRVMLGGGFSDEAERIFDQWREPQSEAEQRLADKMQSGGTGRRIR